MKWGMELLPPSLDKILALGATLKRGHYRSAANYISTYKVFCQRSNFGFDVAMERAVRDAVRSFERGMGAAKQSLPLPMDRFDELPGQRGPLTPDGPLSPLPQKCTDYWHMAPLPQSGVVQLQGFISDC